MCRYLNMGKNIVELVLMQKIPFFTFKVSTLQYTRQYKAVHCLASLCNSSL